jgi:hypothetical protein
MSRAVRVARRGVPAIGKQNWYRSGLIFQLSFLDIHVFEFTGFEDVPALQALDKLGIFIAGNDLYTGVLTLAHLTSLLRGMRRRDWIHKTEGFKLDKFLEAT